MAGTAAAVATSAGLGLIASPYLARLTATVPDLDNPRWWTGAPVTRQRLALTAVTAVVFGALAGKAAGWSALLPAFVALALITAPLVPIDLEHHRLPDRLTYGAAVAGIAGLVLAAAVRDDWDDALRALEGGAAVFAVLFALWFVGGMGLGDVKLGFTLGGYLGWFGWSHVYYGIFAGFVVGSLVAVGLIAARKATRKSAMAFGPWLTLGALIVLAFNLVPSF